MPKAKMPSVKILFVGRSSVENYYLASSADLTEPDNQIAMKAGRGILNFPLEGSGNHLVINMEHIQAIECVNFGVSKAETKKKRKNETIKPKWPSKCALPGGKRTFLAVSIAAIKGQRQPHLPKITLPSSSQCWSISLGGSFSVALCFLVSTGQTPNAFASLDYPFQGDPDGKLDC